MRRAGCTQIRYMRSAALPPTSFVIVPRPSPLRPSIPPCHGDAVPARPSRAGYPVLDGQLHDRHRCQTRASGGYSAEPIGAYVTAGDRSRTVASRRVASCVLRMRPGPPQPWHGRRSAVSTLLSCPDAPRRPDLCRSSTTGSPSTSNHTSPSSWKHRPAVRGPAVGQARCRRADPDDRIRRRLYMAVPVPRLEPPVRGDDRQRERQDMAVRRLDLHPRRQARSLPAARSRLEMAEHPKPASPAGSTGIRSVSTVDLASAGTAVRAGNLAAKVSTQRRTIPVDLAHGLPCHVTARSERGGYRRWPLLVEVTRVRGR